MRASAEAMRSGVAAGLARSASSADTRLVPFARRLYRALQRGRLLLLQPHRAIALDLAHALQIGGVEAHVLQQGRELALGELKARALGGELFAQRVGATLGHHGRRRRRARAPLRHLGAPVRERRLRRPCARGRLPRGPQRRLGAPGLTLETLELAVGDGLSGLERADSGPQRVDTLLQIVGLQHRIGRTFGESAPLAARRLHFDPCPARVVGLRGRAQLPFQREDQRPQRLACRGDLLRRGACGNARDRRVPLDPIARSARLVELLRDPRARLLGRFLRRGGLADGRFRLVRQLRQPGNLRPGGRCLQQHARERA